MKPLLFLLSGTLLGAALAAALLGGGAAAPRPPRRVGPGAALAAAAPAVGRPQQCPKAWKNLLFLHVPKAGGSSIRRCMLMKGFAERGKNRTGAGEPVRYCVDPGANPADDVPYNCPLLGGLEASTARQIVGQRFGHSCNVLPTHQDMSLLAGVGEAALSQTVMVVNLRHPVDRLYSEAQWLRGQVVALGNATAYPDPLHYLMWVFHAVVPNHMTLQLAGQLGLHGGCAAAGGGGGGGARAAPPLAGAALLAAAKAALDRFCVVMVAERMAESEALLHAALGWPAGSQPACPPNRASHAAWRANATSAFHVDGADPLHARLAAISDLDLQLYEYGVALFERRRRELGLT